MKEGLLLQLHMTNPNSNVIEWYTHFNEKKYLMVTLGRKSYISDATYDYGSLRSHILIGRYTSIAHAVTFEVGMNHAHHDVTTYPFRDFENLRGDYDGDMNHDYDHNHYQIVIGNDVWIGCHTILLGGIHIGNGAVIGAGAVIAKDVPPYAVVVGNPARIVRYRFSQDIIEKFQRMKWWYWDEKTIEQRRSEMKSPEVFAMKYDVPRPPAISQATAFLQKAHADGEKVYELIFDARERKPIWDKVLVSYLNNFHAADLVLLVIEVPAEYKDSPELGKLKEILHSHGTDKPQVLIHIIKTLPALDVLPYTDIFISGCTEQSSICADFAEIFGVKVRSGCAYDSCLFQRLP